MLADMTIHFDLVTHKAVGTPHIELVKRDASGLHAWVCECGALVVDRDAHEFWHERVDRP